MKPDSTRREKSQIEKMVPCPYCNHLNPAGSIICENCRGSFDIKHYFSKKGDPIQELDRVYHHLLRFRYSYIPRVLKTYAWLMLIASCTISIWIGYKYGNLNILSFQNLNLTGMVISLAILVQGILIFIFIFVIASLSESFIDKIMEVSSSILASISEILQSQSGEK
jgi:hypothetical protein